MSQKATKNFNAHLSADVHQGSLYQVTGRLKSARGRGPLVSQQDLFESLDILGQIDVTDLFHGIYAHQKSEFSEWLFGIWEVSFN